jgi:hypothetical protein
MATHAGQSQDVGLDTGAARGIGGGEGQYYGREIGFGVGRLRHCGVAFTATGRTLMPGPALKASECLLKWDFTPVEP